MKSADSWLGSASSRGGVLHHGDFASFVHFGEQGGRTYRRRCMRVVIFRNRCMG